MEESHDNNIILNNNIKLNEIKQRKRRHSLPLKPFQVTSPEESRILSIIFDNIFEDVNIEQNNNLSMIDLGTKINLKYLFEDIKNNNGQNSNKKVNSKLSSSKTFQTKESPNTNKINEDEEDNEIIPVRRHKKSFIFNNILQLKMIKCPRLLEEQWKFEKILLDYNIIDFTSKNNFFYIIL